jgi:flavin reductase (DIM6/NTAB) family NADH-FMN oxidoreductase RutF
MSHSVISPAILFWGTPVLLVTSENEDGTENISAVSSVWWLGHRCVIGLNAESKTPQNIIRTGQCVVNLPDDSMTHHVNLLADTTGTEHLSASKIDRGYRYVKDKWTCAQLTPQKSDLVRPSRILECPVQMECELAETHEIMKDFPDLRGGVVAIELKVLRIHVVDEIRMPGYPNRIDPDRWRPLISSFQEFYGLNGSKLSKSRLGKIEEEKYRAFTRSRFVTLPGDGDKEEVEARFSQTDGKIENGN